MAVKQSRTSVNRRISRTAIVVFALTVMQPMVAAGQPGGGGQWSGYQRKGYLAGGGFDHGDRRHFDRRQLSQQVSSGWFQRPYPYHLDYYRMKYGGSYAPYFGNLYGPPNYFYYGAPYYGDYSPYYGFNGIPGGYGNGYGGPYCSGPDCFAPFAPPLDGEAVKESQAAP